MKRQTAEGRRQKVSAQPRAEGKEFADDVKSFINFKDRELSAVCRLPFAGFSSLNN